MAKRDIPVIGFTARSPETEQKGTSPVASPVDQELPEPMDPLHRAAVEEGRAQFRRGEVATDEQIETAFHRFGP